MEEIPGFNCFRAVVTGGKKSCPLLKDVQNGEFCNIPIET